MGHENPHCPHAMGQAARARRETHRRDRPPGQPQGKRRPSSRDRKRRFARQKLARLVLPAQNDDDAGRGREHSGHPLLGCEPQPPRPLPVDQQRRSAALSWPTRAMFPGNWSTTMNIDGRDHGSSVRIDEGTPARWQLTPCRSRFQIEFDFCSIKVFYGSLTSLPRPIDG